MAININANLSLGTAQFLDARQSVETLEDLLNLNTNIIPNGFECYVQESDLKYKYNSYYDEIETGKWRLVDIGQSAGDVINDGAIQSTTTYSSLKLTEEFTKKDDMTIIDLATLESMLGISTEELETLASLIDDTQVSLNKVWSSSKTYAELTNTLDSAKQYTLQELAKAVGASYKVVTSVSSMTDAKVLYLMKSGDTYGIYVYDETASTAELIGDFSINLDDYYTKDETEAQFVKQTDLVANYATKEEIITDYKDLENTPVVIKEVGVPYATIVEANYTFFENGETYAVLEPLTSDFSDFGCDISVTYNGVTYSDLKHVYEDDMYVYGNLGIGLENAYNKEDFTYDFCVAFANMEGEMMLVLLLDKDAYTTDRCELKIEALKTEKKIIQNEDYDEFFGKFISKENISTNLDVNVTDEQVPSAKAVYEVVKDLKDESYIEITAAEYTALSEEEKNNGTMYLIPDMTSVGTNMVIEDTVTKGSGNLVTSGAVYEAVSQINSELDAINESLNNRGLLLIPYVTLESGTSTQIDSTNNWSEFKGFVLGIECTGGDGTSYCETKYIPRNYATITDSFKHVMSLNYSDSYSFIGFARLYVSSNKVTFVTTAFTGWSNPKWFLYGIK